MHGQWSVVLSTVLLCRLTYGSPLSVHFHQWLWSMLLLKDPRLHSWSEILWAVSLSAELRSIAISQNPNNHRISTGLKSFIVRWHTWTSNSLVPRPLQDFYVEKNWFSCKIKSGSSLGARLNIHKELDNSVLGSAIMIPHDFGMSANTNIVCEVCSMQSIRILVLWVVCL